MRGSRRLLLIAATLAVWAAATPFASPQPAETGRRRASPTRPERLTHQEFWALSRDLSEPGGFFRSENLVSNEHTFQYVIPALKQIVKPGGVYLGVAPDQNFTYIVATQQRM